MPTPIQPSEAENYPHAPFFRAVPIPSGPFDVGNKLYSVCVNGEWWARMLGALEALLNNDTWQGTLTEQQAAVQEATRLLSSLSECEGEVDMTDCCEPILQRLDSILSKLDDLQGATTSDRRDEINVIVYNLGSTSDPTDLHPSAPDVTLTEGTGDVVADFELRERALCGVIATLVYKLRNDIFERYSSFGFAVGSAATVLPVVGWIGAFSVWAGTLISLAAQDLVFITQEVQDDLICCMKEHLIGVDIDHDSIFDALDACNIGWPYNDLLAEVNNFLAMPTNMGAFLHDLGSAYEALKFGSDFYCPCDVDGVICDGGDGTLRPYDFGTADAGGPVPDALGAGECSPFAKLLIGGCTYTPAQEECLHFFQLSRFYGGVAPNEALVARISVNGAHWTEALDNESPQNHVAFTFDPPQLIGPESPVRVDLLGGGGTMCHTGYRIVLEHLEV